MEKAFIINILVIYGVHASTRGNMILGFVGDWIFDVSPILSKVLFDCTPCMTSLYGSIGFFFTDLPIQYLPIWVFSMCGTNYIVNKLLNR
jgi:hypothetical protein